jgi:sec-independent protein translocase protein TatA
MGRGLFEGWHIVILIVVIVLLFGWKRMPDAARSLGRSMRIFKSEVGEMKNDGKPRPPSAASSDTVRGETVQQPPTAPTAPTTPPAPPVNDTTPTPPAPHPAAPTSQSPQPPA